MENILLKKLLQIIKDKKSISLLVQEGYSYAQLGTCIVDALSRDYLTNDHDKYQITDKGETLLKEKKKYEQVESLESYKLQKSFSLEEIYIPKYNKGDFER